MIAALDQVWPHLADLLDGAEPELRADIEVTLRQVLDAAGLPLPEPAASTEQLPRGRAGEHTPHLAELLGELQSVARADPEATW